MQNRFSEKPNSVTLGLLIFTVCNVIVNLTLISGVKFPVRDFLRFSQVVDSWLPMSKALEYLSSEHTVPIYTQLFFNEKLKFQYSLTSLLPFQLIENFTSQYEEQLIILNFLSWIAIITTAIFAIKVFDLSSRYFLSKQLFGESKLQSLSRAFILFSLCLMFYPVMRAYALGQVQVFINLFFTISIWFWLKKKEYVSGILVGLMILLKPQYLVIGLWGVVRKKVSFTISLFITFLSGLLISVISFGISNNVNYIDVLKFISRRGESFFPNQSMNGLLNRLLFNGNNLVWDPNSFPPFHPIVYIGTVLTSALLVLSALFFVKVDLRRGVIDFMIIALTSTIASPVAWEHHYGILLVIFAFLMPLLIDQFASSKKVMFLSISSYFLASNLLNVFNYSANIPVINITQSYLFFAALIVLILLYNVGNKKVTE